MIRTIAVGLLGAAAVAAGLVLLRQQRAPEETASFQEVPPGESLPGAISLDRLRELGY